MNRSDNAPRFRVSQRNWTVPLEDGLLVGTRATVLRRLRGGVLLRELFEAVRDELANGPRSPEELGVALGQRFPPALIGDAIRKLANSGVLEVEPEGGQEDATASGALAPFFQCRSARPVLHLEALHQGHVIVFGAGELALATRKALVRAEFGRITHFVPVEADAPRVDHDRLGAGDDSRIEVRVCRMTDLKPEPLGNAALLLACADTAIERLRLFPRVNGFALEARRPWLAGQLDGEVLLLGPLFVPGETGCYGCLEQREESQGPRLDEFRAFKKHLETRPLVCPRDAPPMALELLAEALALEAMRSVSRISFPSTYQSLIELDLETFESKHHSLLKLPFCDVCGPHVMMPLRLAWDL